jgi:PEP-CTERM putative exosortase interaction domain
MTMPRLAFTALARCPARRTPSIFSPRRSAPFGGGGASSAPAPLLFTVTVDPGYRLSGLVLTERGNYFLSGGGVVDALSIVNLIDTATPALSFLDLFPAQALNQTGSTVNWEMSGLVLPPGGVGQTFQVDYESVVGSFPVNGIGFIQKNYVGFRVLTEANAVPEPSGLALLMAGAAAWWAGRRRRG